MNHALIILCGGGSTRMGTDKALLPFGEVSLLEYLVNKYKPHFSHIYLSVKKPGEYTHLSLPVTEIADLYMNAGPMSGVFSGLSMMDEDQAFILPIDTPFLEPEVGLQLLEHLDGFDIAAVSGTETDQKVPGVRLLQKLPAIHRKVSAFAPVHFRYAAREMQRVLSEARRSDQRLRYSGRSSVFPSGYQGRLLSGAPAPSLHLTNLRTAADPASSLRKKSRPGTGCSTSAEGIVPEPA